jgi:integrase
MEKKTKIRITPHMLRRYFANMRRKAGWKLEMISQALGHKHLETTLQYLNMVDDELIEASNEFYEKHSAIYGVKEMLDRR